MTNALCASCGLICGARQQTGLNLAGVVVWTGSERGCVMSERQTCCGIAGGWLQSTIDCCSPATVARKVCYSIPQFPSLNPATFQVPRAYYDTSHVSSYLLSQGHVCASKAITGCGDQHSQQHVVSIHRQKLCVLFVWGFDHYSTLAHLSLGPDDMWGSSLGVLYSCSLLRCVVCLG